MTNMVQVFSDAVDRTQLFVCLNKLVYLPSETLAGQFSDLKRKQQHRAGIFKICDWLSVGVKLNSGS